MISDRMQRRAAFLQEAQTYADSHEPTSQALHALCSRFVEMVAADRGEPVELAVGKVVVARRPASTERGVGPR